MSDHAFSWASVKTWTRARNAWQSTLPIVARGYRMTLRTLPAPASANALSIIEHQWPLLKHLQ